MILTSTQFFDSRFLQIKKLDFSFIGLIVVSFMLLSKIILFSESLQPPF